MNNQETVEIKLNGEPYSIESSSTVENLLQQLAKNRQSKQNSSQTQSGNLGAVAVELNAEIVPHNQFGQTQLESGDEVEVVTLVGGG